MDLASGQSGLYALIGGILLSSYSSIEMSNKKTDDKATQLSLCCWCVCSVLIVLFIYVTSAQMEMGIMQPTNILLMYCICLGTLSCSSFIVTNA